MGKCVTVNFSEKQSRHFSSSIRTVFSSALTVASVIVVIISITSISIIIIIIIITIRFSSSLSFLLELAAHLQMPLVQNGRSFLLSQFLWSRSSFKLVLSCSVGYLCTFGRNLEINYSIKLLLNPFLITRQCLLKDELRMFFACFGSIKHCSFGSNVFRFHFCGFSFGSQVYPG